MYSQTSTGTTPRHWVATYSKFFPQQLSRAGNTVNTVYSVLYQTKSWGRPHRLDTSDTEPYILAVIDSSILSSQSTQHQNQRIICFGMQCSVVGEPLRIELAYLFGKVHRNRNKCLWQCFRFVIACQQVWVSSIYVLTCVTVKEPRTNEKLPVVNKSATCRRWLKSCLCMFMSCWLL